MMKPFGKFLISMSIWQHSRVDVGFKSAKRTIENSPAIHCWVALGERSESVKRTIEQCVIHDGQYSAVRFTDSEFIR